MSRKLTTEEFIRRAKNVHGDKYDYSKVEYTGCDTSVCIICPEHGEFMQRPADHLRGVGCAKCYGNVTSTTEEFVKKAREIHGDKYDYSKVLYKNNKTKVCIICPEHGEFLMKPNHHLGGHGCCECAGLKKLTTEEFIKRAKETHGDKYSYSKVEYVNQDTPVCIICPEHGEFWQRPSKHLRGEKCCRCSREHSANVLALTTEEFIERAKEVHGDKYNYSKVEYTRSNIPVCIICPEHGEFVVKPNYHLDGVGCPICNESYLEKEIRVYLDRTNVGYIYQCRKSIFEWLDKQSIDFFIPKYNAGIECQGIQHFQPTSFIRYRQDLGVPNFKKTQERDSRKKQLCKENGIKLYYFSHEDYDEFLGERVYHNIDELFEAIEKE